MKLVLKAAPERFASAFNCGAGAGLARVNIAGCNLLVHECRNVEHKKAPKKGAKEKFL
ncbi:hypothetical protein L1F30_15780 [Simiduia sp. 21SJ11W-1]|uniref:hypothetical protein n=1 Tax=Simiduia sp. 21SJ11W-1 TaxID=2909669 RepID=UPI00209D1DA5|nr:hypothetical protein [Simiduia sp. 21SJ11W-1]UTA47602.1 hypothetical protein L1F30_15780 [Simiduia sp. 21SJ11W-1]